MSDNIEPTDESNVEEAVVTTDSSQTPTTEELQPPEETVEEQPVESTPEIPEVEKPVEQTKEEEPQQPSPRENRRVQKLLKKYGPPPDERQAAPSQKFDALDYQNELNADPDVIARLEADRKASNEASYHRGLDEVKASEFRTNLRLDLPLVIEKLKKMDPIDAEATDAEYLKVVGFDPRTGVPQNTNIGYAEFVEARIEMAERIASRMNVESAKNIAKQAATTGLRPDGSVAKSLNLNKAPSDMTNEELEAVTGIKMKR